MVAPGGVCVWLLRGACVVAWGVHGFMGGCMVLFGGHVWFYSGDMRGFIQGACMVLFRGHAWFFQGACVVFLGGRAWFFQFFRIQ